MEDILIKAAQLILSLSILVVLHEFGHFLPAKLFGVRVEKFYLFFDPKFSLFKTKHGDTEYGVGWLPLGGYVKLSGMIDESMDKDQLNKPAEPHEFRSKPAWQRLIIMLGGVVVNLILGFLIYSAILFVWGKSYLSADEAVYGVHVSETAREAGFKDGDRVIALNGESISPEYTYEKITQELLLNDDLKEVTVLNNGKERNISLPDDFARRVVGARETNMFAPRVPFVADTVLKDSPALKAGLQKGDRFVTVNGDTALYFQDFVKAVKSKPGESVTVGIERAGSYKEFAVTVSEEGTIGIGNTPPSNYFKFTRKQYGFFEAIPAGFKEAVGTMVMYVDQFKLVFTKEGASQLGGFGTIGNLFPSTWNWQMFWSMTAFLSLILAIMNILPIPALDGGHVMFLLYEIISGRKPGEKFMEYAQITGMIILLGLLLWANGNDIFRALQ